MSVEPERFVSASSKPHRGRSIRKFLSILLVVAVVPALLLQAGIYTYWYRSNRTDHIQANAELARALAATLEFYINDLAHDEASLQATLCLKGPFTNAELDALLTETAKDYPALDAFAFVSPQGKIVATSDAKLRGMNVSDREYFQTSLHGQGFCVTDLLAGRADPYPIFIVARPVYCRGELLGVLIGSVNPARLAEATLRVPRAPGSSISFFDRKGVLAYRNCGPPLTWDVRRQPESGDLIQQALHGQEAVGVIRLAGEGQDRLGVAVPVGSIGWVVGTSEPMPMIVRPFLRSLLPVLAVNVVVVSLSLIGAWVLSRGMIQSLLRLRGRVLSLGEGKPCPPDQRERIAELNEVSDAFNDMIAQRLRAEEALQESEAKYRNLVEESLVGVYVIQAGSFVYVNPRLAEIFGYGPQDIAGIEVMDLVAPEDRALVTENMRRRITGEVKSTHYTFHGLRKDRGIIDVEVIGSDTTYQGKPAIIGSLLDITERARTEEELKKTAAELARSNQDLEQFAYLASHDLQEPLRAISGHLGLIERRLEGQLEDKTRESMAFAIDGASRMQNLIRDLLAYSRVGRKTEGFNRTDMEEVLRLATGNLAVTILESEASIQHDSLPTVQAEGQQMVQLMQNLLGNAIKYRSAERRPEIHVGASREGRGWLFWVKDNGIGIPEEGQDRIFMIFHRLHTRQEYSGTGIGLAICKRIVEYHCGRIWVDSEVGKGSAFYFTIPDRN